MTISRRKLILGTGAGVILAGGAAVLTPMIRRPGRLVETPSRALPVASTEGPLPQAVDVAIIGGGIQGVCSALFLAERGLSVVILEKGEVAGEQSGRAYSQIISWELDRSVLPLALRGKAIWEDMNERIGADTSWRIQPRVQTYATEEGLAKARAWVKMAHETAPDAGMLKVRFIEGAELQQRLPGARTPWKVGGVEDNTASVDPEIGTPIIARHLQTKGVRIFTRCAVRGIETQGGKVSGVNIEFLDLALKRLRTEFTAFEHAKVIERWGGCMDVTADHAPIISAIDQYPGLILNTAHAFGMTQGPAAGEIVADIITGATPKIDTKPYAFSRFSA